MKKILFPVFALAAVLASAQVGIYVADGGLVHVEPDTQVYSKNGLEVVAQTTTTNGFESEGYVTLEGPVKGATTNGQFIRLNYADESESNKEIKYGQLIIMSSSAASTGEMSFKTPTVDNQNASGTGTINLALPFTNKFLDVLNSSMGTSLTALDTGRFTATGYYFSPSFYAPIQVGKAALTSGNILPYLAYDVRSLAGSTLVNDYLAGGIPADDAYSYTLKAPRVGAGEGIGTYVENMQQLGYASNYSKNIFGERYNIIVSDPVTAKTESTWGHNVFWFGNPYTSNFNLTKFFADSGITSSELKAVFVQLSEINTGTSAGYVSGQINKLTCDGLAGGVDLSHCTGYTGDASNIITIKPGTTFGFKLRDRILTEGNKTLIFNDSQKTFSYAGLFSHDKSVASAIGRKNVSKSAVSSSDKLEEFRIELNKGEKLQARVFVTASPFAKTTETAVGDDNLDFHADENSRMSVLEESGSGRYLAINGIDANKYIAKPVQLNLLGNETGAKYSLSGSVRIGEDVNLNNTKFYLEDKATKQIMRVGSNFNYEFTATNDDTNRFVVYYGGTPKNTVDVITQTEKAAFDVARAIDGTSYVVFKGLSGKAKVYAYNVLGQLVLSDENVNMSQNYSLAKLPSNSGVYVIKVVTDSGKTLTKKIIK